MSQNKKLIGLMWLGALVSVGALWVSQREPEEPRVPLEPPGTPVQVSGTPSEPVTPGNEPAQDDAPPLQFRGNGAHTGQSPFVGPAEGQLLWRFRTEGRVSAQAVSDIGGSIYVGSHDGFFYAINSAGRERWKHDLGGAIYSTAAIGPRGHLYVGSDLGVVWSFTRSGSLRWRLDVSDDADTGITLTDGGIVFGAGPTLWSVAFDGTVRWERELGAKVYATPAIDSHGNIVVGCQDDFIYSFTPAGEQRWSYRTGNDNDSSPVIDAEGHIFFGSDDHHVYSLNADGSLRWSTDLDGMVRAPMTLTRDGALLVGVYGPRPRLVALEQESGDMRWYFPVTVADTTEIGVASGPVVDAEGSIYFGAHDDYIYSLAPTGDLRWAFAAEADVDPSPILLPGGTLIVGSDDRHIYAIGSGR